MRIFLYLILLLVMILGVTFAYLNATPVVFNYYLGEKAIPLSLLLLFAFGIGLILGLLSMVISLIKQKSKNIRIQRQLKNVQQEVENLRSGPIT